MRRIGLNNLPWLQYPVISSLRVHSWTYPPPLPQPVPPYYCDRFNVKDVLNQDKLLCHCWPPLQFHEVGGCYLSLAYSPTILDPTPELAYNPTIIPKYPPNTYEMSAQRCNISQYWAFLLATILNKYHTHYWTPYITQFPPRALKRVGFCRGVYWDLSLLPSFVVNVENVNRSIIVSDMSSGRRKLP